MSEGAVHRLSQAWHSVHTHCLCPQDRRHSGLPLGSVAAARAEDAHGLLVSEEGLGNNVPTGNILTSASEAMGACRRDTRMCPRVSGASEDWSHWRVHFLPFWNKTGLPQEIHTKNVDRHFTTETAAKKKVPIAGGNPVCCVLQKQGKGLFFQLT